MVVQKFFDDEHVDLHMLKSLHLPFYGSYDSKEPNTMSAENVALIMQLWFIPIGQRRSFDAMLKQLELISSHLALIQQSHGHS